MSSTPPVTLESRKPCMTSSEVFSKLYPGTCYWHRWYKDESYAIPGEVWDRLNGVEGGAAKYYRSETEALDDLKRAWEEVYPTPKPQPKVSDMGPFITETQLTDSMSMDYYGYIALSESIDGHQQMLIADALNNYDDVVDALRRMVAKAHFTSDAASDVDKMSVQDLINIAKSIK